jgi:cytochrome c553
MNVFVSLVLFTTVMVAQGPVIQGQFSTISDLAQMYNIDECIECHEDTHEEWSQAWHAKSIIDSRVLRTWRTFILRGLDTLPDGGRSNLGDACIRCHAPQIKDASDNLVVKIAELVVTAADDRDANKREAAVKELSKININCLVCHNLKGSPDGNPKEKTIYGPRGSGEAEHREELGFKTVKSDLIPTPEFCAQCHHGCPQGMPSTECPTVYSSYQEDYLAGGGTKLCQDCHMRDEDRVSHRFPGIYEIDNVQKGVGLTVMARPTTYIYHLENRMVPAIALNVQVKNNAGHVMPHG